MKQMTTWLKLSLSLVVIAALCGLLWPGEASPPHLLAQAPYPTLPLITDEVEIVYPPRPPTATPTRIPDDEPPTTTLVITGTPNSHNWYRAPISISFITVDNWVGGAARYRLAGETGWQMYEYFYPPIVITEGAHTLYYYSWDDNHNQESLHITPLNIDLTPPTVSHTLAGLQLPNGWYTRSVTITFKGQDNLSGVDYYEVNLNDEGWFARTSPYRISSTGYYTMAYRAVDWAGNSSPVGIVKFGVEGHNEVYLPLLVKR